VSVLYLRAMARHHAATWPDTLVGCPGCGVAVKGANLEGHIAKQHPTLGDGAPAAWQGVGFWRGRLALEGEDLVLRRLLLPARRVTLPAPVAIGSARIGRPEFISASTGAVHAPTVYESAGACLHVGDRRTLVVRCKSGGDVRRVWRGWSQARRTTRWHITLDAPSFAALQYLLAARGMLAVRA
jgi:hypothetical protein